MTDRELSLLMMIRRVRNRLDFALLKLGVFWTQIQLWRLELEIAVLIVLKRLALWIEGARDEG